MVYRFLFKGYPNNKNITLKETDIADNISIFTYENMAFMYLESKNEQVDPTLVVNADMKMYPDGTYWENMSEIFHYSMPQSDESWKRTQQKTPQLRINYVRHGMIASYIYYHFQYQEEYPCDGDKYGMIFHSGDMLLLYTESPCEYAEPYKGLLDTKNSPLDDDWAELMEKGHFDQQFGGWKYIERLI